MTDFEDREVETLLGRAGGPFPDVNLAHLQVQGKVRQAKRRRAVVVSSAACSLLLTVGILAVSRNGGEGQPAGHGSELGREGSRLQPEDTIGTTTDITISTTIEDYTTVSMPADPVVTTADPVPNSSDAPSNNNSTHSSSPGTEPKTTHPPDTSDAPDTEPVTTSTAGAASITQTFSGIGGTITVHLEGGSLTLLSWQPKPGFAADVLTASGSQVEVRFESDNHITKARVGVEHDVMVDDFSEEET